MKVFWWQAGLHFEPETSEERKALVLLFDSVDRSTAVSGILDEKLPEGVVTDSQPSPCTSGNVVEQLAHEEGIPRHNVLESSVR
jgi:hypothetical protein